MNILCASSHASKVEWKTLLAVNKCILSLMNSMPSIYILYMQYMIQLQEDPS
jgi:hypothetical protein